LNYRITKYFKIATFKLQVKERFINEIYLVKSMVEKYETRCLNCRKRFEVEKGAEVAECNHCGSKWRISWVTPDQPKVQGPA